MADYVSDPADQRLYDAAAPSGIQVLVPRSRTTPFPKLDGCENVKICHRDGGIVPLFYLKPWHDISANSAKYITLGWLRLPIFATASTWPFKEALNDALFRKYRPKIYFAGHT